LFLYAGSGINTIDVNSTSVPTVVVAGLSGNDVVNVGDSSNTLNGIQSHLSFQIANPGSQVILHDEGNLANLNYTLAHDPAISPSNFVRRSNSNYYILYSGPMKMLQLKAGSGSDSFNVRTLPSAGTTVTLDGGSGSNTVQGPDQTNVWQINGTNAGSLDTNIHFANVQNLIGGSGNDTFAFKTGGSIAGTIDGGAGTNTLDYSQYIGNVLVDLPLHLASLVNQQAANSLFNIRNVTGSQGNDLLVGDANPNVLIGGNGRNVLIAGHGGGDTLDAHLSQDDNILIGGWTNWDMNLAALQAIMAEWDRTDLNFGDRRSDLLNGTNSQGKPPLNVVNGQLILLTPATNPQSNNGTVHSDRAADTLIGTNAINPATGKRAHNWFFYDPLFDMLVNFLSSSDKKNKIT
jgi:Ca2+-binding RTX toxin-like protein